MATKGWRFASPSLDALVENLAVRQVFAKFVNLLLLEWIAFHV
jgi:hypothetical protein